MSSQKAPSLLSSQYRRLQYWTIAWFSQSIDYSRDQARTG